MSNIFVYAPIPPAIACNAMWSAMSRRPSKAGLLHGLRALRRTWRWRIRYRAELADKLRADPRMIRDIGLSRGEVEAEIAKPFWRA